MSIRQKWLWILIAIPIFLFSTSDFLQCGSKKENVTIGIEVGKAAPNFSLYDINGKLYSLKEVVGKKPVLIVFWATWCPYCVQEIPELIKIYQEYSKKGLEVWAIDIGEKKSKVSNFATKKKINYTILLDSDGSVASLYQIYGIPENIIIDKNGIIQSKGSLPEDYKAFFTKLID